MVIVGQGKALSLAVRDWRRTPRHTALGGLLAGTTRFARPRTGAPEAPEAADEGGWWAGWAGEES